MLGEEFPLPSEEEIALLAALDFDLLLEMDPYLAEALAEDWAANGFVPDDVAGATLDDLGTYLLDNLEFFAVDDAFLAAMGDSFDLADDALFGLADELGIEFDPASLTDDVADPDALSETEPGDSGEVLDEPSVEEAPPDEAPPVEAPPGDEGGGGEGEGGGDGGGEGG